LLLFTGGNAAEAKKLLRSLEAASKRTYVPAYAVVLVYAGLGDRDQAFRWLENAYQERSLSLAFLKVEPRFDPLRTDARFADLLHRMGLP